METGINKVAENIYHLIVKENEFCDLCGQSFLEFINTHQVPPQSILILETPRRRCNIPCNQDFLTAIENFKAIAYVVNEETATFNPWKHANLVRNRNKNTGYFDSYNDAFNWSIEQNS
jgi:hypothetical protein